MIQTYLDKIKNAIYGKDVRQAIHDAIHQCYVDGRAGKLDLIAREGIEDIKSNIANPNLLINGDFRNPINQRGATSYTGTDWKYRIDRWRTFNCDLTVNDTSITITNTSASDGHFQQVFENLIADIYTGSCSVLEINGSVKMYYGAYSNELVVGINSFTFEESNDNFFDIILEAGASITLEWVKFEQGSIATPFVPRLYGEELALCKRYYQAYESMTFPITMITGTAGYGGFALGEMRTVPTVNIVSCTYLDWSLNQHVEPTTFGKNGAYTNNKCLFVQIEKNASSTLAKGSVVTATVKVNLDAEIY